MLAFQIWSTTDRSRHEKVLFSQVLDAGIAQTVVEVLQRQGFVAEIREVRIQRLDTGGF